MQIQFANQTNSVYSEAITVGKKMNALVKQIALDEGAADVGVSSVRRLTEKVSMDPGYLLPGAKSIITFLVPLDGEIIRKYLGKESQDIMQRHETDVYRKLDHIGNSISEALNKKGYPSIAAEPNLDYRFKNSPEYKKIPYSIRQKIIDWFASESGTLSTALKKRLFKKMFLRSTEAVDWNLTPSFSHRYGAVAGGIATMGWSGNVLHPDFGAHFLINTVITQAEIQPDPLMDAEVCNRCHCCVKVCQAGMIHSKETDSVVIGGKSFEHNKKGHNLRCTFVCAGLTGQNLYKGWSTWSPGRFELPETDDRIEEFWTEFANTNGWRHNYYAKILSDLTYHTEHGPVRKKSERFKVTCGNCLFVCAGTLKERKQNYETIINSGEVIEGPDFSFQVVKQPLKN
jgi:epoxyqueuosine reductase